MNSNYVSQSKQINLFFIWKYLDTNNKRGVSLQRIKDFFNLFPLTLTPSAPFFRKGGCGVWSEDQNNNLILVTLSFDHASKVSTPQCEICERIGWSGERGKVTSSNNCLWMSHKWRRKHFSFTNQQYYVALSCIILTNVEEKVNG